MQASKLHIIKYFATRKVNNYWKIPSQMEDRNVALLDLDLDLDL